jgi:hypothetical protein
MITKTKFSIYYCALFVFISSSVFAQMGYNNGMGGGMNRGMGGGMNRGMGASQYNDTPQKEKKIDYLQASLDNLEKELSLDTFQKTVIKEILVENQSEMMSISKQDIPDDSKIEKMGIIKEKLQGKIIELLNPDQIEKFAKMKEKMEKKKKKS